MPGDPSAEDECSRLLVLAESELSAGRLRTAHKHARRAARLDPDSPRAPLLLTATSVLLVGASSHYATLLLPTSPASPLSPSSLRRHYKSLSKSLSLDPASAAAQEALSRAFDAYAALTAQAAVPVPPTFWTTCAGCCLLHEFERKYLGILLEGRGHFEEEAMAVSNNPSSEDEDSQQDENKSSGSNSCIYSINARLKKFSDWLLDTIAMGDLVAFFPAVTREYAPVVDEMWKDPAIQATYKIMMNCIFSLMLPSIS